MAKITLPNGQTVEIDSSGNILNPGGSIFTGGGATVPTVTPDPVQTVSLTQQTFGADNKPIDEQRTTNYNSVDNPQNFSRGGGSTLRAAAPTAPIITRSVGVSSQNSLVGANSGGGDGSEGGSGSDGVQKKKEEYITLENERGEKRIIYNPEINKANIASLEASGYKRTGTQPRTFETRKSAAEEYADTFTPPETAEQIRDRKTKAAADLIKTTNEFYQSKLNEQNEVNQLRTREANAQSVLSGLMGSTEAGNKLIVAADKNSKANQSILAEKALALSEIYYDIQTSAEEEASKQKEDAMTNAKDIIARKAERQKKGVEQATLLAKSGFDLKGIRDNDPVTYNHLLESAGGEKELEAYFTLNRPIENIVDKQIKDGKYVIAYQNPLTGKVTIETADLGLPVGYSKTVDAGNRILAIPDNWDGSPDKLITINKGLTPEQARKAIDDKNSGLKMDGLEYGTPAYTLAAIKNSSQYGDKRLLSDERKNIVAAKRALGSLETYNSIMDGTLSKDVSKEMFGEGTGIIKGRLRTLASVWGADPSAAAVNATIQGIIPTVARGIFQEVGVLTDQDIANYKKTVPDINKPENANKLIELVLLKTLERAYADTLITAAQNQTNVSNFAPEYENIVSRLNKLQGTSARNNNVTRNGQPFDASDLTDEEYADAIANGFIEEQ